MVWSVVAYGAAVWGTQTCSCIDSIQNRAMRVFLGVIKSTPSAAVSGEMAWQPVRTRHVATVSNYWISLNHMQMSRVNKRIFVYCFKAQGTRCRIWCHRVVNILNNAGCDMYATCDSHIVKSTMVTDVTAAYRRIFTTDWLNVVTLDCGRKRTEGNKLRTYKLFKNKFETEAYCKVIMSRTHRAAFAKFRCGVAPIRLETGRY
jgi:hypothetical protein